MMQTKEGLFGTQSNYLTVLGINLILWWGCFISIRLHIIKHNSYGLPLPYALVQAVILAISLALTTSFFLPNMRSVWEKRVSFVRNSAKRRLRITIICLLFCFLVSLFIWKHAIASLVIWFCTCALIPTIV